MVDMLNQKIGILGGGQLGKMLYQAATPLHFDIHFMDQSRSFPVGQICPYFTEGNFKDFDDVISFGEDKDIISIEIEAINVDALFELEKRGKKVYPQASIIQTIQDKGLQKEFFVNHGFKTSSFITVDSVISLREKINQGEITYPFVQKLRKDGYDGKGVQVIKNESDLVYAFDAPSVIEDLIEIAHEIAVIVARTNSGQCAVYEPVDMIFDHKANLLDYQLAPAGITDEIKSAAKVFALEISQKLGIVGLLAVEMFLDKNGELWINELAPRAHNSGHHTIEACVTSQYEQQLRCLLGLPLGGTALTSQSLLMNLLGEEGYTGSVSYEGLDRCLSLEGVHVHIYGKELTKPYRKMGHVNIVDSNIESAMKKYNFIKENLKVISHE